MFRRKSPIAGKIHRGGARQFDLNGTLVNTIHSLILTSIRSQIPARQRPTRRSPVDSQPNPHRLMPIPGSLKMSIVSETYEVNKNLGELRRLSEDLRGYL